MSKGHPELILPMKDGGEKRAVKESVFESGTDTGRMTAEGAKGAERGGSRGWCVPHQGQCAEM